MKSIVTTYPDFQSLPKGVKMMLVASESLFFDGSQPGAKPAEVAQRMVLLQGKEVSAFCESSPVDATDPCHRGTTSSSRAAA